MLGSALLILSSCSEFSRLLERENDIETLLTAAGKYYEEEEFRKSMDLYEKVQPMLAGSGSTELVAYRLAMGNFKLGNFLLSDFYFRRFYENFGRSPQAEEATYLQAYSVYKQAPESSLDPTKTNEAIQTLQSFINRYPNSVHVEEASQYITELRVRLEQKAYDTTILYWNLSEGIYSKTYLEAALLSFENFERDFPDSAYREEIAYLKILAQFRIADNSVPDKKEERLRKTLEFYDEFIGSYPGSEFTEEAGKIYDQVADQLSKINT
jgi:outer membrane protein assembly factor BamD